MLMTPSTAQTAELPEALQATAGLTAEAVETAQSHNRDLQQQQQQQQHQRELQMEYSASSRSSSLYSDTAGAAVGE